ncbi:MAG: hypothetical protein WBK48_05645 [Dethiobacteria bacterium]|jgi:hypothetical protein
MAESGRDPKKSLFYNRALFFTFLWAAVAGQCRTMAINPEEFFSFFFKKAFFLEGIQEKGANS